MYVHYQITPYGVAIPPVVIDVPALRKRLHNPFHVDPLTIIDADYIDIMDPDAGKAPAWMIDGGRV